MDGRSRGTMVGLIRPGRMAAEDFLDWEERQEPRYELVDGRPVMMVGGSAGHELIAGNVFATLRQALRGRRCRAYTAGLKVATGTGNLRYPDVLVDCGPFDPKAPAAAKPTVIVEVLSPSTWSVDLHDKVRDYGATPSVHHYLVVAQDRPLVMTWTHDGTGLRSGPRHQEMGDAVDLSAIDVCLALADIYEGIAFDPWTTSDG